MKTLIEKKHENHMPNCSHGKTTYTVSGKYKVPFGNWTQIKPPIVYEYTYNNCPPTCPKGTTPVKGTCLSDTFAKPSIPVKEKMFGFEVDITISVQEVITICQYTCRSNAKPISYWYIVLNRQTVKKLPKAKKVEYLCKKHNLTTRQAQSILKKSPLKTRKR